MRDISFDETSLFLRRWVSLFSDRKGLLVIVVIVAPFSEMIGKLVSWNISIRVLEVDHNQLLVLVCRVE